MTEPRKLFDPLPPISQINAELPEWAKNCPQGPTPRGVITEKAGGKMAKFLLKAARAAVNSSSRSRARGRSARGSQPWSYPDD